MPLPDVEAIRELIPGRAPSVDEVLIEHYIDVWKSRVSMAAGDLLTEEHPVALQVVLLGAWGETRRAHDQDINPESPVAQGLLANAETLLAALDTLTAREGEAGQVSATVKQSIPDAFWTAPDFGFKNP